MIPLRDYMIRFLQKGFIGVWGQRHLRYLKEYRSGVYLNLLTSGSLSDLVDIEEQAQERFERIVEQMEQSQGVTEQLKVENVLEWIGLMNNIQACAREIVENEIIHQQEKQHGGEQVRKYLAFYFTMKFVRCIITDKEKNLKQCINSIYMEDFMVEVNFYDNIDDTMLKFAVIISKTNGKWVFCKHK